MNAMKNILSSAAVLVLAVCAFVSCNQPSELPPLNSGYATTIIMPDPQDLTDEDMEYIASQYIEHDIHDTEESDAPAASEDSDENQDAEEPVEE